MVAHAAVGARMRQPEPLAALLVDRHAGLADELIGEQAAAHADLAMNPPDREIDALSVERLLPGEDVLIDAVDERAVEVEQEYRLDAHGLILG